MSLEASLWKWLAKARTQLGPALDMNRIENWIEPGTPDVEGYLKLPNYEGQFWLELKAEERPAQSTTRIRFKVRAKQIEWINRRWDIGANVFWFVQVGAYSERRFFLVPGPFGFRLLRGLTETELAVECCNSGVFNSKISQETILKQAITCRKNPSLTLPCPLPPFSQPTTNLRRRAAKQR